MLSKAAEYAIRAVIYIAKESELNNRVGVTKISEAINSPVAFTGKILQKLSSKGIIISFKGPKGGFMVDTEHLKKIRLSDVVTVFDDERKYISCIMGLPKCNSERPCPIHHKAKPIISDLEHLFENNTIYDVLYEDNKLKKLWLK